MAVFHPLLFLVVGLSLNTASGYAPTLALVNHAVSRATSLQRSRVASRATSHLGLTAGPLGGLNMLGNLFGGKAMSPEEAGLIPAIYPAGTAIGSTKLRVKYPSWVKASAELGNIFSLGDTPTKGAGEIKTGDTVTPTQAQSSPVIGWEAEKGSYYTLIMTDPDPLPKDPSMREWAHWIRCNIPGDNLPCDGKDGGDNVKVYVGSGPGKGTGVHKYFFLLYKQPGVIEVDDTDRTPFTDSGRSGFKTSAFAEKYELGTPVGFTFFKAEYDNYVPELYARLKGELK